MEDAFSYQAPFINDELPATSYFLSALSFLVPDRSEWDQLSAPKFLL